MARFKPRLCPVGALTAAWQNVVPRQIFMDDPRNAAMTAALKWIEIAKEDGLDGLELAAALSLPDSYIDPATLLDPVAAHLAVRSPVDSEGEDLSDKDAETLIIACDDKVSIWSLGAFENLLHPDPKIRAQVHRHTLRVARAAAKLKDVGCRAVTGFIGRDWTKSIDENFHLVVTELVPLWRELQKLGVKFRIENCPMPGWRGDDEFFHNIACVPAHWVLLFQIAAAHGLDDVLELNYDVSHDILMGNRVERSFQVLAAAGFGHKLGSIHCKDQHIDPALVAAYSMHGQRAFLPHSWAVMVAHHGMPGISHYNPQAMLENRQCDWVSHQIALRLLGVDPRNVPCVIEHEWFQARQQNEDLVRDIYGLSVSQLRAADQLAEGYYQSPAFCEARKLTLPGSSNPLFEPPAGLAATVAQIRMPAA